MKKERWELYLWLFGVNLFISAFTFGGGYVVIPMVRKYFVLKKNIFTENELMDMAAIAQSSPGAIAVNLSALAGYRAAGLAGLFVSCLGALLPPILILAVISSWYGAFRDNRMIAAVLKGMEAGVAALIVDLVYDMCRLILKEKSLFFSLLIPGAFLSSFVLNLNVALILIVSCGLCIFRVWVQGRRNEA